MSKSVRTFTDELLIAFVTDTVSEERARKADVIRGLSETERRKLYAKTASSSLWDELTKVQNSREPTACRRGPIIRMMAKLNEEWEEPILVLIATGDIKVGHLVMFARCRRYIRKRIWTKYWTTR